MSKYFFYLKYNPLLKIWKIFGRKIVCLLRSKMVFKIKSCYTLTLNKIRLFVCRWFSKNLWWIWNQNSESIKETRFQQKSFFVSIEISEQIEMTNVGNRSIFIIQICMFVYVVKVSDNHNYIALYYFSNIAMKIIKASSLPLHHFSIKPICWKTEKLWIKTNNKLFVFFQDNFIE